MRRENIGVLAAIASSAIGGIAGGTTRFAIGASDPVTLGVFRFGVGFLLLLPVALAFRRVRGNLDCHKRAPARAT